MPSSSKLRETPCIAVIADMVKSRDVPRTQRPQVQLTFTEFVAELNRKYKQALVARFVVTLGDEFQGLLSDALIIPDLLWDMHYKFGMRQLRVGIGFGSIDTPIGRDAINVDGPALHHARNAIDIAKKDKLLGGVFEGFGAACDPAFNGFARLLQHHRARLKPQQRKVIELLRQSWIQSAIAQELGITRQAVSLYAGGAGWEAYREGEEGWRALLAQISFGASPRK
ncbi:MAG TPA: SatD family protein [Candidatus Sulfotelmatobacter sp.]|nr:SatD family protein [Candidatus Sulfotelmatobacter sp.]